MKKLLLLAAVLCLLNGCGKEPEPEYVTMGNPWNSFETLAEAEEFIGFSFGLPEMVAGSYEAEIFRAMKGAAEVLEVTYQDDEFTVTVRKSPGEGQDIAGVYGYESAGDSQLWDGAGYTTYRETESKSEPCALYMTADHDGYSWSVYAPNGFWGDSAQDFLTGIFESQQR